MPKQRLNKVLLLLFGLACLGLFGYKAPTALAANPSTINFQGKVVNADGTNVTNGTYSFNFVLFDDPTLGSESDGVHDKWHELNKSVQVTNGVFQTELGSATALPDFSQLTNLYLAVKFNNDSQGYMTPRIHLDSVPYALNSDKLGGLTAAGFIQNNTNPQSANFNVQSASSGSVTAVIQGASGQSVDIVDIKANGISNPLFSIGSTGNATFRTATGNDSLTAFQVQNSKGFNLLTADTQNIQLIETTIAAKNTGSINQNSFTNVDGTTSTVFDYTAVAMAGDGFARIAYVDYQGGNNNLDFIQCTNAACSTNTKTVVDSGGAGESAAIAIASDGFARIAYRSNTGQLKFAQCTNITCSIPVLTTVDNVSAMGTSLAMGSDGFARMAYYDVVNGFFKFAQCTNASCSTNVKTIIDSSGFAVGNRSSLAIASSDGFARLTYSVSGTGLVFAQCTNAACSTKNVSTVNAGNTDFPSVAIASDGFARISYEASVTNGDLKYAQCTNAACSTSNVTTVDNSSDTTGLQTSLALASDGFARISYYDQTAGDLRYAQCQNDACSSYVLTNLDSAGDVGNYDSLVLGTDGFARISYYDATNSHVKMARLVSNSGNPALYLIAGDSIGTVSSPFGQLYAKGINLGSNGFIINPQTDSTNALMVQNASGSTVLGVDTANFNLFLGNISNSNSVKIASGATSSTYTITLPTAASAGTNYCLVGTTSSGNTTTSFMPCGAGSTASVTLTPEYAGAVMTGNNNTGNTHTGTMTSDFCSGSTLLNVSPTPNPCGTSDQHNYYAWTANATNDYDVFVQWQAPSDFASFNSITFNGQTSSASDAAKLTVYKKGVASACGTAGTVSTAGAWGTASPGFGSCSISAGDTVTFDVDLKVAVSSEYARAGEITIVYNRN